MAVSRTIRGPVASYQPTTPLNFSLSVGQTPTSATMNNKSLSLKQVYINETILPNVHYFYEKLFLYERTSEESNPLPQGRKNLIIHTKTVPSVILLSRVDFK